MMKLSDSRPPLKAGRRRRTSETKRLIAPFARASSKNCQVIIVHMLEAPSIHFPSCSSREFHRRRDIQERESGEGAHGVQHVDPCSLRSDRIAFSANCSDHRRTLLIPEIVISDILRSPHKSLPLRFRNSRSES